MENTKIENSFKFILRNLMPNIEGVFSANNEDMKANLLENVFCITNLSKEEFSNFISQSGNNSLLNVFNPSSLINKAYYLSNNPFFCQASIEFKIDKKVSYNQIFEATKYLAFLSEPLVSYALMVGGETVKNQVQNIGDNLKTSIQELNKGKENAIIGGIGEMIDSVTGLAGSILGGGTTILQTVVNIFNNLLMPEGSEKNQIFYFPLSESGYSRRDIQNSRKAFSLASVFSAKLFSSIESPFPVIKLTITNVAEKSIDEHVPLINFISKLVTPLTLAMPIYPVQLIIADNPKNRFSEGIGLGEGDDPYNIKYQKGLNPFTYTQNNVGYFNVTGISIKAFEGSPWGTTDSTFYQNSGLPLPIIISIELSLEAYDPFYYNFFDPGALFMSSNSQTPSQNNLINKKE